MKIVQITSFAQDSQVLDRLMFSDSITLSLDGTSGRLSSTGSLPFLSLLIGEFDVLVTMTSGEDVVFKSSSLAKCAQFSIKGKEGHKLLLGKTTLENVQNLSQSAKSPPPPSTDKLCRVCYDAGSEANPLIAPCRCTGDTQFIHTQCLQSWVRARMPQDTQANAAVIRLPNAAYMCEICRGSFLANPQISMYQLLQPYLGSSSYGLYRIACPNRESQIVAIQLSSHGVSIGRAHDADLCLGDLAVSRNHAKVSLQGEEMTVADSSRTGTWVLCKEVSLLKYRTIVVRVADFTIEMRLNYLC